MNRLRGEDRVTIVNYLTDGCSMRSISSITAVARNTIDRLLVDLGAACAEYQDHVLRKLSCQRIEVDECWAFRYCKQKQVTPGIGERGVVAGDAWTWAAIDADTKLIPSWIVGPRDSITAQMFVNDLAGRLTDRMQLTSDGLSVYLGAVERAFHGHVEYAQLAKIYGNAPETQPRYSHGECVRCERHVIDGNPDPDDISARYIEGANLRMRMEMRRFVRLTDAFSKKIENHVAAIALHMMHHNFVRIHPALRCTPAMAANVTDRFWEVSDIVALLERGNSN